MGKVTESIFSGLNYIIPLADVSHIQRHWYPGDKDRTRENYRGIIVITKHTTWDAVCDDYANSVYISRGEEAKGFLRAWCDYRSELESETLMPIP